MNITSRNARRLRTRCCLQNLLTFLIVVNSMTQLVAQVSITSTGSPYVQQFNSLASSGTGLTWTNGLTLQGWYAASASGGNYSAYNASTGGSTTTALYSFGSSGSSDRALGSLNQDASGDIVYGVLFANNSGVQWNSVTLSYRVEQWRKAASSSKGYQRVQLSYTTGTSISVSSSGLLSNTFMSVPEGTMVSLDTTTTSSGSMDGNANGNFANIEVTIPVVVPVGSQLFIRFYDENNSGLDVALGLDDFSISFSSNSVSGISAVSDFDVFEYLDQGILKDIPDAGQATYLVPQSSDLNVWSTILQNFYSSSFGAVDARAYGYIVSSYEQAGKRYHVLRKESNSNYFWGTYVTMDSPGNPSLTIQAPHPITDILSERQAAAVYWLSGAHSYMVAGASRCTHNDFSTCSGTTQVCGGPSYRLSDVAHNDNSIFQVATEVLAEMRTDMKFVQLHGFGQGTGEPEFIISSGIRDGLEKEGIDYPALLREAIQNSSLPERAVKVTHLDDYGLLSGLANVQGRFLNNYPSDICSGTADPVTVSNRFIQIEQYIKVRELPVYYATLASIINEVVNESTTMAPPLPIDVVGYSYEQDFDFLDNASGVGSWANNMTIPGWYAARSINGLFGEYRVQDGSGSSFGIYAFGRNGETDRALGTLNQDASGDIAYGVLFVNNTGDRITTVNLSYRAEQWRKANSSTVSQRVNLGFATSASFNMKASNIMDDAAFTFVPEGDMVTIDDESQTGPVDGNSVFTQIEVSIPVILEPGHEIFIRFSDKNAGSLDKAMALDDLLIQFVNGGEPSVPSAPVANSATGVNSSQFNANWSASAGATGYRLDVSSDANFSSFLTGYNDLDVGNVLTYLVQGLSPGVDYYYRVRSSNAAGQSGSSNIITVHTDEMAVPSAPIVASASGITSVSFIANWNSSAGSTGYELDVATDISFANYVSGFNSLDVGNVLSYQVTGLSANTDYYYRVRAYNSNGTSVSSSIQNVKTKKKGGGGPGGGGRVSYTNGTLEIQAEENEKIERIAVYEITGALLFTEEISNPKEKTHSFVKPELAGKSLIVRMISDKGVETSKYLFAQ